MILQIDQVTANGENRFEIFENGCLLFKGSAPFYKPTVPVGGEVFRRLSLTDANDTEILHTDYNALENLAESAIPLSWLFKDAKRVRAYSVLDSKGSTVGAFYYEQVGVADKMLVMQYGERSLACYMKEAGKKEIVSVYDGETEVGQITKPNCVFNNLDRYLAHFTDDFAYAEMISLFVIYYDFIFHNHSGELITGWRAASQYTIDKNSKKYDKKFIADHFGKDENDRVEQFITDAYAARKKK